MDTLTQPTEHTEPEPRLYSDEILICNLALVGFAAVINIAIIYVIVVLFVLAAMIKVYKMEKDPGRYG